AKSLFVVPSSLETAFLASELGLRVLDPRTVSSLDVYVDGVDELDRRGFILKGGGGALLGEKIMAYNSSTNIFILSEEKLVEKVGSKRPIPIEVEPGYLNMILKAIESLGLKVKPRPSSGKRGPTISDWGGIIMDLEPGIEDLEQLEELLKEIPGVVETGVFIGYADYAVIGRSVCGYEVLKFERRKKRKHL
ncbi:MAG: ribose 5-phosphate isomerase A, partial [Acidilobaceae archaeon]